MKFCWCTITVSNMAESLKFYQEVVKLPVQRRFPYGPKGEIVFLGEGETAVELIDNGSGQISEIGKDISLGFEVASLDEMLSFVKERGMAVDGPFQPNPHVKFFYVKDPSGVKVQFVQNS